MTQKISLLTILTLLITLLSACNNNSDHKVSVESASTPQSTSPMNPAHMNEQLIGTWQVESIDNMPVIDRSPARIVFKDQQSVSGSASCNNFSTSYMVEGKLLTIKPAAVTRKMCAPVLMDQESKFLSALAKVKSYKIENDMLYLTDESNSVMFKASREMKK
jgi:heat shock protein HslJ